MRSSLVVAACASALVMGSASAALSDEDTCVREYGKAVTKIIKLYMKSAGNVCQKDADPAVEGPVLVEKLNKVVDKYNNKIEGKTCDANFDDIVNELRFFGSSVAELLSTGVMTGYSDPANGADTLEVILFGCNGMDDPL